MTSKILFQLPRLSVLPISVTVILPAPQNFLSLQRYPLSPLEGLQTIEHKIKGNSKLQNCADQSKAYFYPNTYVHTRKVKMH